MKINAEYTIYTHTTPTKKVYVGITSQKDVNRRWQNGLGYRTQTRFYRAIKKYGWNNIEHRVLFRGLSKKEAEKIETCLISLFKSNCPAHGYNIENGGNCTNTHSEETKRKISEAQMGEKNHMYGKPHPMKGKKRSAEFCEKNRIAHLGQKGYWKGKKLPESVKEKMRGRIFSEEHKKKLSTAKSIPVRCVETGEVFESGKKASEWVGVNRGCIAKAIKGRWKAGGYHWEIAT